MADDKFWRNHAWWPLAVLIPVFAIIVGLALDRPIANALYYSVAHGWIGKGAGDFLAHRLMHDSGRWVIRAIAAGALVGWIVSYWLASLAPWRREIGFVFVAMALAIGIVGLMKNYTNVDCPWDLVGYGGNRPYVEIFADRPDYLPRAQCFPGAHSSSGFALFAFYFALRDRRPQRARIALFAALGTGLLFSIAQESRGAHFISHDLASAGIVWLIQLGLYALMLKGRGTTEAASPAS